MQNATAFAVRNLENYDNYEFRQIKIYALKDGIVKAWGQDKGFGKQLLIGKAGKL